MNERKLFKPATRQRLKARIAITGPTKSGKTYTGLRWAFTLAREEAASQGRPRESARVAVIDTEHGTASIYQGISPDGYPWAFDVLDLSANNNYSPVNYAFGIEAAGREGFDALLVDSLTHAWQGVGGALDQVDKASSNAGGKYSAWRDVTPQHLKMIEAILACPCHLIATMRSKMAHELDRDSDGKMRVRKLGLQPIQRENVEYEFNVVASMDLNHTATIEGTRGPTLDGLVIPEPGPQPMLDYFDWLKQGEEAKPEPPAVIGIGPEAALQLAARFKEAGLPPAQLQTMLANAGVVRLSEVDQATADGWLAQLAAIESSARAGIDADASLVDNPPPAFSMKMPKPPANDGNAGQVVSMTTAPQSEYQAKPNEPCGPVVGKQIIEAAAAAGMAAVNVAAMLSEYGVDKASLLPMAEATALLGRLQAKQTEDIPF